ncbi:hypothetical protein HG537_0F01850 [Torulaspora globosa]|uniref:Vacuolar membrane protein n=1 Tax=Torulaspora globosa TaxID=48254 RepID=A0A7H9HUL1_9SACH|nr:hypothetical protein HG537_0F01850 [Torulaspora sp. CBS 2947]
MVLYKSDDTCQLLGPVSITIQLMMGVVAVGALLVKRNHEHPRRKMIVWMYDVGKQISGALAIHFINLGLSILQRHRPDFRVLRDYDEGSESECDWYFVNLLLDTTLGIPILWGSLILIETVLGFLHVTNVESGNYFPKYDDETVEKKPMFSAFLKQLLVFIGGLSLMKLCILLILKYFENAAYWFANLILGWSDNWPNFQVFLIMFVCPILLNCFQYFCVDNIIKLHTYSVNLDNVDNFETESLEEEPTPKRWDTNSEYGTIL